MLYMDPIPANDPSGLSALTATANFVGGDAQAVYTNALAPGKLILINNAGAYFNPIPVGQAFPSNNYNQQIGGIVGGSARAKTFLLLHELSHLTGLFKADSGIDSAQKSNNDLLWFNCGKEILGFSN